MNDVMLIRLKILVERAVRPVRASTPRKRKMREELLAHVVAVFDEEAAKASMETTALERTCERFGQPAELTAQLQQSLSWRDRVSWLAEALVLPPGMPPWRRAIRHATALVGGLLAVMAFFLFFGLALVWIMEGSGGTEPRPAQAWKGLPGTGIMLGYFWVVTFIFSMIAQKTSEAVHGPVERFWPRVLWLGALTSVVAPVGMLGFPLAVTWDYDVTVREMSWLLPAFVILPPFVLVLLAKTARQIYHGVDAPSWLRNCLIDGGGGLATFAVACGLSLSMPGAPPPDLAFFVALFCWLTPMLILLEGAVLHSWNFRSDFCQQIAIIRENEEWANLRLN